MKRGDVPAGMHVAVPAKDSGILHSGSRADKCAQCRIIADLLVRDHVPAAADGTAIGFGSRVRLRPEYCDLPREPDIVTITGVRLNTYTGDVWLSAFACGENAVIMAGMVAEVLPAAT